MLSLAAIDKCKFFLQKKISKKKTHFTRSDNNFITSTNCILNHLSSYNTTHDTMEKVGTYICVGKYEDSLNHHKNYAQSRFDCNYSKLTVSREVKISSELQARVNNRSHSKSCHSYVQIKTAVYGAFYIF